MLATTNRSHLRICGKPCKTYPHI